MANDITKAVSANPIKNGTAIVTCDELGNTQNINTYASNKPAINEIEAKYDNRFYNGIFVKVLP